MEAKKHRVDEFGQEEPTDAEASSWPLGARLLASAAILFQVCAVISAGLGQLQGGSNLLRRISDAFGPYYQLTYQGWGYGYYAPNPAQPQWPPRSSSTKTAMKKQSACPRPDFGPGSDSNASLPWRINSQATWKSTLATLPPTTASGPGLSPSTFVEPRSARTLKFMFRRICFLIPSESSNRAPAVG